MDVCCNQVADTKCCSAACTSPGDKPKQDLVAAPAADGSVRHRVGLDEQLVPRSSLQAGPVVGKVMLLVGGRHEGLTCVVKDIPAAGGGQGELGAVLFGGVAVRHSCDRMALDLVRLVPSCGVVCLLG